MTESTKSLEPKVCIQSEKHEQHTSFGICTLLEHQSLVDIAICCGNSVLHAHKAILAANSPFFREEFEKNPNIEQILLSGSEFSVIRSLIEFMYCGETYMTANHVKYLCALGRMLRMKVLENLCKDLNFSDEFIVLPMPQFLTTKPKYPAFSFNNTSSPPSKPRSYSSEPSKKRKGRDEVQHQACLKEAQASRRAIANLKKEIGIAPQTAKFIIEDGCSETTVENFIPTSTAPKFLEVNLNNQIILSENQQFTEPNLTAENIKNYLENEADSNVEIMFKTNDGKFVTVTDDVLQNLQEDGLQYQVVDDQGRVGEIRELELLNKTKVEKVDNPRISEAPIQYFSVPKIIEMPTETDLQNSLILPLLNDNETAHLKNFENNSIPITEHVLLDNTFSSDIFLQDAAEEINVLP